MQMSCTFKTSDGRRKDKGKKKPRKIQQRKQSTKVLLRQLGYLK